MKKIVNMAICALAAVLLAGCATTTTKGSGIKGKSSKMAKVKTEIVDYQGASFGSEIPEWVVLAAEGQYSTAVLSKSMPGLEKKKVFVTIAQGDNLDFVKQWTDLVDIEVQVGDTMQRVVGKAVSASESAKSTATGKTTDPTEMERKLDMYKEAVSAVEVNGLEKVASYWIEKVVTRSKKDVRDVFEYYAVWAMDQKQFDAQLNAALSNVADNTSEGVALKATLREKLSGMMISSNELEVEEAAEPEFNFEF